MSHETTTGEVDNSLEPEEVPVIQQPPPVQQLPSENGENTHEMAMHLGLPPPEPLDLSGGNVSENWKKFKQKYTNYEIATGINTKESATRVAVLLTVIGNDAIDVFNTLMWDEEGDDKKIDKVLLKFEEHCEPKKNVTYERYKFFSRAQESGETIDQYVTVLRRLSETCEFETLKNSLIKDRIVLGVNNTKVRERLLRVQDLTLEKALDVVRSAEATERQLKELDNDQSVHGIGKGKEQTIFQKNAFRQGRKTPSNQVVQLQELWNQTWHKGVSSIRQDMSQLSETTSLPEHVQVTKESSARGSARRRARFRTKLFCWSCHYRSSGPE